MFVPGVFNNSLTRTAARVCWQATRTCRRFPPAVTLRLTIAANSPLPNAPSERRGRPPHRSRRRCPCIPLRRRMPRCPTDLRLPRMRRRCPFTLLPQYSLRLQWLAIFAIIAFVLSSPPVAAQVCWRATLTCRKSPLAAKLTLPIVAHAPWRHAQ